VVPPSFDDAIDGPGAYIALHLETAVDSDVDDVRRALARAHESGIDDTERVAALLEAGCAYAGDLIPESFAEWLAPERERLLDDVVAALRRLAELLEARRDLLEAIRWARRLTEIDPLDEVAYRAQMRLHATVSDRAAAVHAFHRCANMLERELGVEPAPETRELYRNLIEHPADIPRARHAFQAPQVSALVGRELERECLLQAWRATELAGPRVACIVGEPGIGKSRLADEVARRAEREGAGVARARAYAAEGQLSYAPVVEWLRSPAIAPHLGDLDPVWRAEIGRLVPEVLAAGAPLARPETPLAPNDDAYARRRLFEAAARALLAASRPLVLVLDDLQWCDPETLALVHYVSRYRESAPLYILASARSDELADNEPARRLLLALQQEARLVEVELGPLAAFDVAALLRAAAGERCDDVTAEVAERLYTLSEGNPLFVLEALHVELDRSAAAETSAPSNLVARSPRVRAVLAARFAQLPPRARALAECAATIGRAFDLDVVRAAADLDERDFVPALDELWRRRIVREHPPSGYDFSHDLLREVAGHGVSPARARLLHRRVAEALERTHASGGDEHAASLAAHYEIAGLPARATEQYRRAAQAAAAVHAHDRASCLLERALTLIAALRAGPERDREELAILLARAPSLRAIHGYTHPALQAALERARSIAESLDDASSLFLVLRNLCWLRFVATDLLGTLELAQKMAELAAVLPEVQAVAHHARRSAHARGRARDGDPSLRGGASALRPEERASGAIRLRLRAGRLQRRLGSTRTLALWPRGSCAGVLGRGCAHGAPARPCLQRSARAGLCSDAPLHARRPARVRRSRRCRVRPLSPIRLRVLRPLGGNPRRVGARPR
jgi:hypothetical protein